MTKLALKAQPFIETRSHHESELAEDYVEIIAELISLRGQARVSDIARCLGVSHVTVVRTLERLKKKGFLCSDPHAPISLSNEGLELAKFCKERHLFLLEYLTALGVPENVAAIDVEGMEHHISQTTIEAFQKQLQLLYGPRTV